MSIKPISKNNLIRACILLMVGMGIGSYLNFFSFDPWLEAVKAFIFAPVPLVLIVAFVIFKIYLLINQVKQMLDPKPIKPNDISVYEKERHTLETGDVVAFSGNDPGANIIKIFTHSDYSHVGLVVKVKIENGNDRVCFIEADPKKGVVLVRLSSKLSSYKGMADLFKVKRDLNLSNEQKNIMSAFAIDQLGDGYDFKAIKTMTKRILARVHGLVGKLSSQDDGSFICSELVGRTLLEVGLIDKDSRPEYYTPNDIAKLSCLEKPLKLIK